MVQFAEAHCVDCHSEGFEEGGLAIDALLNDPLPEHAEQWEAIVRKLAARQMPPVDASRPSESEYDDAVHQMVAVLDRAAAERPHPGRTESFRRLNQTEYQNAIRDLLDLDIDVREMLPSDEASHGFDNVTVANLSPVLLDRYVSAAQKISRLAIGDRAEPAAEEIYRVRPDVTQDAHLAGTPIGTRGGTAVKHYFPQDGEYEIQAWLMRDRNEEVEGLRGKHQLEFAFDRDRLELFTIAPPSKGSSNKSVDEHLKKRFRVAAGPHELSVAFLKNPSSLLETNRQPLNVHFNYYRHPRIEPAVYQVAIRGPYGGVAAQDTPSRRRVFVAYPQDDDESEQSACAEQILRKLMRRAYRREATDAD
ncbi:MAG: DUF1587 domain-containing protein, partial [Planctomycetota bacterium]